MAHFVHNTLPFNTAEPRSLFKAHTSRRCKSKPPANVNRSLKHKTKTYNHRYPAIELPNTIINHDFSKKKSKAIHHFSEQNFRFLNRRTHSPSAVSRSPSSGSAFRTEVASASSLPLNNGSVVAISATAFSPPAIIGFRLSFSST